MNKIVIEGQEMLIPAKWQECTTKQAIAILQLLKKNKLPQTTLVRALWLLMGFGPNKGFDRKAVFIHTTGSLPQKGSTDWWRYMYTCKLTEPQRQEFLLLVEWIYTPIHFKADKNGMLLCPDVKLDFMGGECELPGDGIGSIKWRQFVAADLALRNWQAGDPEALVDLVQVLFDVPDSRKPLVRAMDEAVMFLVAIWYQLCLKHLEACHPHVFPKTEDSEGEPDPYGLTGLTHRLVNSPTEVQQLEEMEAWSVLANFEIKLVDAAKAKANQPTAA